jgi:hypothetical protein
VSSSCPSCVPANKRCWGCEDKGDKNWARELRKDSTKLKETIETVKLKKEDARDVEHEKKMNSERRMRKGV